MVWQKRECWKLKHHWLIFDPENYWLLEIALAEREKNEMEFKLFGMPNLSQRFELESNNVVTNNIKNSVQFKYFL